MNKTANTNYAIHDIEQLGHDAKLVAATADVVVANTLKKLAITSPGRR
jgi:hypothetical protein